MATIPNIMKEDSIHDILFSKTYFKINKFKYI